LSKLADILEEDIPDDEKYVDDSQYPKMLRVDGYDVNHYYDGDVPVYDIYDKDGSIKGTARSTSELHEITGGAED